MSPHERVYSFQAGVTLSPTQYVRLVDLLKRYRSRWFNSSKELSVLVLQYVTNLICFSLFVILLRRLGMAECHGCSVPVL